MRTQRDNHGFTLIELIIVIVILGILAVTAAPRFIDISSDAKTAKIESIAGSIKTSLNLLGMKAQIANQLDVNEKIETMYGLYDFQRGIPEAKSEVTNPYKYFVETFIDLGEPTSVSKDYDERTAIHGDIKVYEINSYSIIGYPDSAGDVTAGLCYVKFNQVAELEIVTSGC